MAHLQEKKRLNLLHAPMSIIPRITMDRLQYYRTVKVPLSLKAVKFGSELILNCHRKLKKLPE